MNRTEATFTVRPIRPDDRDELARFYSRLSPDSLVDRFHGAATGIGTSTAQFFCGPDHEHREGLVAEAADDEGRSVIIGHLCMEPAGRGTFEMAIAVADGWRRRGVGRAMLHEAIDWGRCHGLGLISASIRMGNPAILGLIRSVGYPVTFGPAIAGVVDVRIDISTALPQAA